MRCMTHEFDAVLVGDEDGPGCGFALPFDPKDTFGKARAPVRVSIDGHPEFRTTVAIYGGTAWIGVRKDQRSAMSVDVGDSVHVQMELDDAPRVVQAPPELVSVLAQNAQAEAAYDALSYSHRKKFADWVAEGKRQETRDSRAAKAVHMLLADKP